MKSYRIPPPKALAPLPFKLAPHPLKLTLQVCLCLGESSCGFIRSILRGRRCFRSSLGTALGGAELPLEAVDILRSRVGFLARSSSRFSSSGQSRFRLDHPRLQAFSEATVGRGLLR
jgi:hypothetical protein